MAEYKKDGLRAPIEVVKQQAYKELSAVRDSLKVPPVFQDALPPVTVIPRDTLSEAIENVRIALSLVSRSPSLAEYMVRASYSIEFEPEKSWFEKLKEQFTTVGDRRRFSITMFSTNEATIGEPLLFFREGSLGQGLSDSDLQSWWDRGACTKEITYLASLNREKILTHLLKAVS